MYDKKIFANNLIRLMEVNGKSRRDVCDALEFNYFTFTDWINGKKTPRMDKVEKLSQYFSVSISDLLEEKTETIDSIQERARFDAAIAKDKELQEMLKMYIALPDDKKKTVRQMIEDYFNAFA